MIILDKINNFINKGANKCLQFDPTSFNDEIALKTEWTPTKSGGTNICTHYLKEVSNRQVVFFARPLALLFPVLFMVVGLVVIVVIMLDGLQKDSIVYFGLPFGSVFFCVGFLILRSWLAPRVFDLTAGYYWKGNKKPNTIEPNSSDKKCKLADIYAIQLLKKSCSSEDGFYFSYELNLIKKDGKRLNVLDHGKLSSIRSDSEKLSNFLNIPVWDTTVPCHT